MTAHNWAANAAWQGAPAQGPSVAVAGNVDQLGKVAHQHGTGRVVPAQV